MRERQILRMMDNITIDNPEALLLDKWEETDRENVIVNTSDITFSVKNKKPATDEEVLEAATRVAKKFVQETTFAMIKENIVEHKCWQGHWPTDLIMTPIDPKTFN